MPFVLLQDINDCCHQEHISCSTGLAFVDGQQGVDMSPLLVYRSDDTCGGTVWRTTFLAMPTIFVVPIGSAADITLFCHHKSVPDF